MQSQEESVSELMIRIRSEIKKELENQPLRPVSNFFTPVVLGEGADQLRHSDELHYLNRESVHVPSLSSEVCKSHRGNFIGKALEKIKMKFFIFLEGAFAPFLESEKKFRYNLVRFLNSTSLYIDMRDGSNFKDFMHKVDVDVAKMESRVAYAEDTVRGALSNHESVLQKRYDETLATQRNELNEIQNANKALNGMILGLERTLSLRGEKESINKETDTAESSKPQEEVKTSLLLAPHYLLLENRFRGSEADIKNRVSIYGELFSKNYKEGTFGKASILEVGAGRGELQEVFKERGLSSYGIDLDEAMVARCKEKNLSVSKDDGVAHLKSLPNQSLQGVIAIQVVEHLTLPYLEEFLRLCSQKTIPGGLIIFETINPQSLVALSSNYFRDPTHVFPRHPETLAYQCELAGIEHVEIHYSSFVPKEAEMQEVPLPIGASPSTINAFETINQHIARLNRLLYGAQDFYLVGSSKGI